MFWIRKTWIKFVLATVLILSLTAGVFIFILSHQYQTSTGDRRAKIIIIKPGIAERTLIQQLAEAQIITSSWSFKIYRHVYQRHQPLQAGEYAFPATRTPQSVLEKLTKGQRVVHKFTVIEGQTSQNVVENLRQNPLLQGEISTIPIEGSLCPQTYHYLHQDQRAQLLARMTIAAKIQLEKAWQDRDSTIPLTSPTQAVILASLIEKETCLVSEQPRIAGLFYNRLALNMPLQSDPTILYGLYLLEGKSLKRDLSRKDLRFDHLFNTYLYRGLPPTPICNPGLSALTAALHPASTKDLYFVADGTGGHVFSQTYPEHQRHHQALRQRRQKANKSLTLP